MNRQQELPTLLERIQRCRSCGQEVNQSPLTFLENPFCDTCLKAKLPRLKAKWEKFVGASLENIWNSALKFRKDHFEVSLCVFAGQSASPVLPRPFALTPAPPTVETLTLHSATPEGERVPQEARGGQFWLLATPARHSLPWSLSSLVPLRPSPRRQTCPSPNGIAPSDIFLALFEAPCADASEHVA
jgi:hypothetical protein